MRLESAVLLTGALKAGDSAASGVGLVGIHFFQVRPLEVDGVGVSIRFAIPTREGLLQSGFSASQEDVLDFVKHIEEMELDQRLGE